MYLAEVRKQKGGFMGKAATELKLLACQRNDRTWSAVPGEEIVPGEEVASYENGALVMVEIGGNRIQGAPKPGGPSLVSLLENFSKLLVGQKEKDEEIEAWNQSLTIQAQELNQREMELEAELTQLEQLREEVQGVEDKLQAADAAKAEADRLQEELSRKTNELEQAWEHLRGEQRKLEEQQGEVQPATGAALDSDRAARLLELVSYLETTTGGTEALQAELEATFDLFSEQQADVDAQWQDLEAKRARATESQAALDRQAEDLSNRRQKLQETTAAFEETRSALQEKQKAFAIEQESLKVLQEGQQATQALYEMLSRLAAGAASSGSEQAVVDIAALETMPLGELQEKADTLQKDLSQVAQFVNEQEEELTAERQEIEELEQKLGNASEYDRINLEQELSDARDRYKMLDAALVDQRREVQERESILSQHLRVLQRRQGIAGTDSGEGQQIDLRPVLAKLEAQKEQQQESLQASQARVEEMRDSVQPLEATLAEQTSDRDRQQQELQQIEADWLQQQISTAELWAAVHCTQEILQSLQDRVSQANSKLDTISEASNSARETSEYQRQAIASLREIVDSLT
nr:pilus motility taxis protein HmpF [Oscillatoria sp. FACHB-1406]